MKPFLKWAGGKQAIAGRILKLLPKGKRLIEPFVGSASVFMSADYPSALLADSNPDLIGLYRVLQADGDRFIHYCESLFIPENNNPEVYYAMRAEFNGHPRKRRKAALFLYLNRHGYNGLCRYNASGGFNVPLGRYAKPYFPASEMRAFYHKSQHAEFEVADFKDVMRKAVAGDVVYCDPPYVPLSRTANFTSYRAAGFTQADQQELAELAEELGARGVPVVISNHDTSFTERAYKNAHVTRFDVRRFISSNANNRGKAEELLALFKAA